MILITDTSDVSGFVVYGMAYTQDPDTIRYVGQTTNFKNRHRAHRKGVGKLDFPVYKWMGKYGFDNILFYILEICDSREELDGAETAHIEKHNTYYEYNSKGMNYTTGGRGYGAYGYYHNEETKSKISAVVRGENAVNSILKEEDVVAIRELYFSRKKMQTELAEQFGVSRSTIAGIIRRRRWTYLPKSAVELNYSGRRSDKATLDEVAVREVRQRVSLGETQMSIAHNMGISRSIVQRISAGTYYHSVK